MKNLLIALAVSFSAISYANELEVKDFNYSMTDVAKLGLNKEDLFKKMNRTFVSPGDSICANRAHMWSFDFLRDDYVDAAKIFVFFTEKSGGSGEVSWWYHVAPMIGENNKAYVMDAAFRSIKSPITKEAWLKKFAGTENCKEISASETDLLKRTFKTVQFPATTEYGTYDCYYKIAPASYWFPASIAMGLLGVDSTGKPVHFNPTSINRNEVYQACLEAGNRGFLGNIKKKCRKYLDM